MTGAASENTQAKEDAFIELLNRHMDLGTGLDKYFPPSNNNSWTNQRLAAVIGRKSNTVANYRNGRSLPPEIEPIEHAFFGSGGIGQDPNWDARAKFRETFNSIRKIRDVKSKHHMRRKKQKEVHIFSSQPNFAIRVPRHLCGCDRSLAEIEGILRDGRGPAIIYGMPGLGKTVLAHAYAGRHGQDYRLIWQIDAQSETACLASFASLGQRLGWTGEDMAPAIALDQVTYRLAQEGRGLLLIFENAPNSAFLGPYLPWRTEAHILITSNDLAWHGTGTPVRIETWPKDVGADFLLTRINRSEDQRPDAEILSALLGGLPLAHEQAAAYCDQSSIPLKKYRELYEKAPTDFLSNARATPVVYGRTVAKTFSLAIGGAAARCDLSSALIACASLLETDPIPFCIFSHNSSLLANDREHVVSDADLEEAVAALRAYSLIDRAEIADQINPLVRTDCLFIHRLIREIAAPRKKDQRLSTVAGLITAFTNLYPREVARSIERWPELRLLEPHSMHLLKSIHKEDLQHEYVMYWLNGLATYFHYVLKEFGKAAEIFDLFLSNLDWEGEADLFVATIANNMGLSLIETDQLEFATKLFNTALHIRKKHWKSPHVEVAVVLNNRGISLYKRKLYEAALKDFQEALRMYIECCGQNSREVGEVHNNAANIYIDVDELERAGGLLEAALYIAFTTEGPEHFKTANSYSNLALVRSRQGRTQEALDLFKTARGILAKLYGEDDEAVQELGQTILSLLFDPSGNPTMG